MVTQHPRHYAPFSSSIRLIMTKAFIIFGFLAVIGLQPSYAILEIKITEGKSKAIPIAVARFFTSEQIARDDIGEVVMSDLNLSGAFRAQSGVTPGLHDINQTISEWKDKGVQYVVMGAASLQQTGNWLIQYQLVSLYGQEPLALNMQANVAPRNLRRFAHAISNKIYELLLGKKGFFDSSIAYVLKQRKGQHNEYRLILADFDGQREREILRSKKAIMSPDLSSDGRKIAYVSFENDVSQIYVQDLYTGNRQLISGEKGINSSPSWSPDNTKLAYVLSKDSNVDVYMVDLASMQKRRLTKHFGIDTEPAWLSNEALFFTSNRGGGPQIYELDISSLNKKRITFRGGYNTSVSTQHGGEQVVFVHRNSQGYQIALQNLGNGLMETITASPNNVTPSFSPNGEMVLYATSRDGRSVLGLMSVDGKHQIVLPSSEGEVIDPVWSR
ncbi:MAG: Tol-Pal system beta propeller repeat protein TolB [Pseudomonadota bacterium]